MPKARAEVQTFGSWSLMSCVLVRAQRYTRLIRGSSLQHDSEGMSALQTAPMPPGGLVYTGHAELLIKKKHFP